MSLHAPLRMSFPPDAGMFNETFAITTDRPVNTNETTRKRKNMKKLILGVFLAVCWCTGTANAQDIAAKTNLLYWSTTTPNLSLEFGLGQRTTLDLTGAYNPWTLNKDKNKKIKHWLVMPEFRYWLCERYNGHFFGLHSGYAYYNISGVRIPFRSKSTKDHRYQGWASGFHTATRGFWANVGISKPLSVWDTSIPTMTNTNVLPAASSKAVRKSTTSVRPRRASP